ncbi:MAG: hypothetical protein HQL54_14405, partial [Magnetococcales bacterium]|nr:hypothetical protein [Magnetococcales bacterium]
MMRVTQSMLYQGSLGGLQGNFQEMKSVQDQTLSGSRLNKPSDDPASVFRDMMFSNSLEGVKSLKRTTGLASERLALGENHITVMHEKFLDAQDLILKLGNDVVNGTPEVLTAASREALALYQDVLKNANAELDGVPLFSGGKSWVPFDETQVKATDMMMRQASDSSGDLVSAPAGWQAQTDETVSEVPMSVRLTYNEANAEYEVDVNGETQTSIAVTGENPQTLDLGNGVTVTAGDLPEDGDALYFEVVPRYLGGEQDRLIKVSDDHALAGNVTGEELIEGKDPPGRGVNLFEALSGLRGALLRADTDEISARLAKVSEGRAQASDLQNITGIRTKLVDSVSNTLDFDQYTIEESKAVNKEVDLFDAMSRLEQANQAMQVMTISERQIL